MSGVALQAVTFSDIALLAALHAEAFPEDPWNEAAIKSVLGMPGAFGRLASENHSTKAEPIGFSLGLLVGPDCELLSIGVLPNCRRRHVASRLIGDFLEFCRNSGAEAVFLEVAEDNHAAKALYNAHQFDRIGRRPHYYRRAGNTRVDALQLRRLLA